jgi:putative endopeptidase
LKQMAPNCDWEGHFKAMGAPSFEELNVSEPDFIKGVNTLLEEIPLDQWKAYLRWHYLRLTAGVLGKAFVDERFNFYGKTLQGIKEPLPRWKRCLAATSGAFPEPLGQAYVALAFGPESRSKALDLVGNLKRSMATTIQHVDWLDLSTREAAQEKLGKIVDKIGYPDQGKDYSSLKIDRKNIIENVLRTIQFHNQLELAKIGKPVDRAEWLMGAHQVNAYYHRSLVEIVFPAAILQPPFFEPEAPIAHNYGSIGSVMGHELTHGFDDAGRKYDAEGNLKNWWSPLVEQEFKDKAACLVEQYSGYTVGKGIALNGELTLGENIADLGGIKLSYAAWQTAKEKSPPSLPLKGYNEEQQFFLAYAQTWCTKSTPELEELQAKSDPHSISKYRVNGIVSNLPQFAKAFGCKVGTPMAPKKQCSVW